MKPYKLIFLLILATLVSCDKESDDATNDLTDGFCIVFGNKHILDHSEIDFYDFSTHMVYLKDDNSFLKDFESGGTFTVYADKEEIYSGLIHPPYSSYLPSSPTIQSYSFIFQDFVIPIKFVQIIDSEGNTNPDNRADEKIAQALKKYNQYHEGLSVAINSVQYSSKKNEVVVKLKLQNDDTFNYYYLDPEKMGMDLFHYFTNGMIIRDLNNNTAYSHKILPTQPEPWDSWKPEWLTLIKSKENKQITLTYNGFDAIPSGGFKACFSFPGLTYQVERADIQQENGRIWLGEIQTSKEITIK
jgi:hypothetical protein